MGNRFWLAGAFVATFLGVSAGVTWARPGPDDILPGPIKNLADVQDTAQILFKLADTNLDHQISKKEAIDAGNLLVGGFFFRADANGDGTLTPEEARAARESLEKQRPWLAYIWKKASMKRAGSATATATTPDAGASGTTANQDPFHLVLTVLDGNNDQKLQAAELKQAVQTGVDMLFSIADANQDGQLAPAELNAAVDDAAKAVVQAAFQTVDTDKSGTLSLQEYENALKEPAHAVFRVLDGNNDQQLSLEELEKAQQVIINQLERMRLPEPSNSLRNRLRTRGAAPAPATTAQPGAIAPVSTVQP